MSFLKVALELAASGFHVFPLAPNSKLPVITDYPNEATRDPDRLKRWWLDPVLEIEQPLNIGISTTHFGDNEALIAVDVDNKEGKKGNETLINLELQGLLLPKTFTQTTPTLGFHIIYKTPFAVRQGVGVLGPGIDIRSKGGYIVATGSRIDGKFYSADNAPLVYAPTWLVEKCGKAPEKPEIPSDPKTLKGQSLERAIKQAIEYLKDLSAAEAGGRNHACFATAAHLKDLGLDQDTCVETMLTHWRCEPMLDRIEVENTVRSAYKYGQESVGVSAPENEFTTIESPPELHPFDVLNKEFAFVTTGGGYHILWETTDSNGNFKLEHLNEMAFHQLHASKTISFGDGKTGSLTKFWMKSPKRRSYSGICFKPGIEAPENWYNLWRGFAVEPWDFKEKPPAQAKDALSAFLDHARTNICRSDDKLFNWLMSYCAHIIQRPWEKPLVAPVFRGAKGVGKNVFIERIGALLGHHYFLTSNRRFLTSNFNGHLENLLLFVLDEAFWSGDKQAEGTIKDLITGKTHNIEHKGKEAYTVENCTRIVIIGNEDWLVPATHDERRFAVFDVGAGRKQDTKYFKAMREGMEAGGHRLLLSHLMELDISQIDLNQAPMTSGLLDQKILSLEPVHSWWFSCLNEGRIIGGDFNGGWPTEVDKERLRRAFVQFAKDLPPSSKWKPKDERYFGKQIKKCLPSIDNTHKRREGENTIHVYRIPNLDQARKDWESFVGGQSTWEH